MCYAIPGKITKLDGDNATVDYDGVRKNVNVSIIEEPQVGSYVLVHAGFAIEKLTKQSGEESLALIRQMLAGRQDNG